MLKITDVQIQLVNPNKGLIGFANVILNDVLILKAIGIHKKRYGDNFRLTFPIKNKPGQDSYYFHPLTPAVSQMIEEAIFKKIKDVMQKDSGNAGYNSPDPR